jgi:hypothetical protein
MPKKDTQSVAVQLSLGSTQNASPFNITKCQSTITDVDGQSEQYSGWNPQDVGKPKAGGADFTLRVEDLDYASNNKTTVENWVLTCLRRGGTKDASPFSANDSSISGSGGTLASPGIFTLDLKNAKIKNAGSWDWSLLVQIAMPDNTTVKCFVSDPEMDVQAILLT